MKKQLAEVEWREEKNKNNLCINTAGVSASCKFLPLPNETSITKPLTAEQLAECPADKHEAPFIVIQSGPSLSSQ